MVPVFARGQAEGGGLMDCFFTCPNCGTYRVDRPSLEEFIKDSELKDVLKNRLADQSRPVSIVTLEFKENCELCEPGAPFTMTLSVQ